MFDIEIDDTHEIILIESVKILYVLKIPHKMKRYMKNRFRASVGISVPTIFFFFFCNVFPIHDSCDIEADKNEEIFVWTASKMDWGVAWYIYNADLSTKKKKKNDVALISGPRQKTAIVSISFGS